MYKVYITWYVLDLDQNINISYILYSGQLSVCENTPLMSTALFSLPAYSTSGRAIANANTLASYDMILVLSFAKVD